MLRRQLAVPHLQQLHGKVQYPNAASCKRHVVLVPVSVLTCMLAVAAVA